ncbi:MAG: tripartite tricarboxylate transporter substrate binding protein [Pseudomonadota bacterium]|nr:tripartite tricarboxylate transporter substrate binding protein [Pseudomonadota bacterium]
MASYPAKAIRIIVPFPPGGTTDVLARILSQRMTAAWGQPVLVENRPGAGSTLGADMVAKSPADGYTLLMGAAHHTIAQSVYAKLPYHFGRDFAPVSVIAVVPNMVVVNAAVPARTIEEFVALAKSQPGKLNYGTAGAGTAHHLIGEMFKLQAGVDLQHIPYKGSAPAVSDLVGGQVQVMFDTVTSGLPQVKAGKTRALAVTTAKRSSALPDVPTLSETVLPGFDVGTWFGVLAPAGTPAAVIEKIRAEIDQMVNAPDIRKQFLEMGAEPVGNTPAQMAAQIKSELTSYEALAKQIRLVVD